MDFSEATVEELKKAQEAIQVELENRKKYIMGDTCRQIRAIIKSSGLDFDAVMGNLQRLNAPSAGKTVKYRHPDEHSLTWGGKGKKPLWLQHQLDNGAKLEDFAV